MTEKRIIGRKDKADFPEFHLEDIDVKIDTGAYTSSIHCHSIEKLIQDKKEIIKFQLFHPENPSYAGKFFSTSNFKLKPIKSSTGHTENRYIINTTIILYNIEYPIEMSLAERGSMRYPVLLGRKLLRLRFLVDPTKVNCSYRLKLNSK